MLAPLFTARHLNVFVSSTSRDLIGVYRDGIREAILANPALYPIMMENFNPTEDNAVQLCYSKVAGAQIFVGVYAYRYGYAPPPDIVYQTPNGIARCTGEKSITHMEYDWARERKLPLLLYLAGESLRATWDPALVDDEPNASRLEAFKTAVKKDHVVGFFNSPEELAQKVSVGITEVMHKLLQRQQMTAWVDAIRAGQSPACETAFQQLFALIPHDVYAATVFIDLLSDSAPQTALRVLRMLRGVSPQSLPDLVIAALRDLAENATQTALAGAANSILRTLALS